jgi:alkyl sulfatase BDS1-like metallo-beta-lactamase superfamily hydrolase
MSMSKPIWSTRPSAFEVAPAQQSEARKILDFVYLSEGLSNSFLITTPEGRMVINTGMGFEGPTHKRLYDAVDDSPIRYVVFTQGHVDHVGGTDVFLEPGTEILAHANNQEHQSYDGRLATFRARRSFFAFMEAILQANAKLPDGPPAKQSRPVPTMTFSENLPLDFGGQHFEFIATPGGETRDSLIIHLPEHKAVFSGNLFSCLFGHIPNLCTMRGDRYRDALEFAESAERVLALDCELLLVGHGPPLEGRDLIRREIERVRDAALYLHDETVRGMNDDKPVDQLMQEIQLPEHLAVGEGYGKVSWDIRAIWENYSGWFHQRSTTELFETSAASIHADLVELSGGSDAIGKRARTCLDAGEPVKALHLTDIALSVTPRDPDLLAICRDAHRALEKESTNFWETKWLQHQASRIEGELSELKI